MNLYSVVELRVRGKNQRVVGLKHSLVYDTKPTNREGFEYNFKLKVTNSTPDYPPQDQYSHLGWTYGGELLHI